MKRDLLLTLSMMTALAAGAAEIGPEQALQRAMDAAARDTSTRSLTLNRKPGQAPQLSYVMNYTQNPAQAAVYVFSAPDDKGYIVSPADDRFPALLGYSDTGSINAGNIPPQMQWWLSEYAREMDYAIRNGLSASQPENVQILNNGSNPTKTMAPRTAIAPLLETKYNQSEPYNNQCPVIKYTDGTTWGRAVTGCVATAMAQMMRYWKYPAAGQGSHSYICEPNGGQSFTESMDFSTVTFDWDNMLTEYTYGNYTDTQAAAVAQLMHACGVSVNMTYTPVESGAQSSWVGNALRNYFKYDSSLSYAVRGMFSNAEWEQLIYNELAASRPVQVNGRGSGGGHAFVCDGYQGDHYFHFNWGWGGSSDGYFMFSALNPGSLGIGGGSGGFNYDQSATYNIFPPGQGTPQVIDQQDPEMMCNGNFSYGMPDGEYSNVFYPANNVNGEFAAFYNVGSKTFNGYLGIMFRNTETSEEYIGNNFSTSLDPGYGYTSLYSVMPDNIPDGEYKVYPVYRTSSSEPWAEMKAADWFTNFLYMSVNNEAISAVTYPEADPETLPVLMTTYFSTTGTLAQNESAFCEMSFLNVSEKDYRGNISMIAGDSEGNETTMLQFIQDLPADICMASSGNITLTLAPGDYDVYFKDDYGRKLAGTYPITVLESEVQQPLDAPCEMYGMSPTKFSPSDNPQTFESYWRLGSDHQNGLQLGWRFELIDSQGVTKYNSPTYAYYTLPGPGNYRIITDDFIPNFGIGTYTMKVKAHTIINGDESAEYDACRPFPVIIAPVTETVTLDQTCELTINETKALTYSVTPISAAGQLQWTSSNPDVVTVDAQGNATGKSVGTATVTVCSPNGRYATCKVTVNQSTGIETPAYNGTVRAVYTTQGIRVLENASEREINALPDGIYIIVTDKDTYKTTLNR
mgnify:CR=1 FL=1